MRRAIGLLVCAKASMVVDGRGIIKSISNSFPRPSVIRLNYMVKRPRPQIKLTRKEVFRRDNYTCQYCGAKNKDLTIDHIYPKHLGGKHTWSNVVTACSSCNHRKGGRTLRESNMRLLSEPRTPPNSAHYIFGQHLTECTEWEPFIRGW